MRVRSYQGDMEVAWAETAEKASRALFLSQPDVWDFHFFGLLHLLLFSGVYGPTLCNIK